ncbi:MAG: hypothetical protein WCO75_10910, partial [Planctomycetota bacterium]
MKVMMIDVESLGLHGDAFAVAWLVVETDSGEELDAGFYAVDPTVCAGEDGNRKWCNDNIPKMVPTHRTRAAMRDAFWPIWLKWQQEGAVLAADVPWPVEARFLADCIDDDNRRCWQGPYPILDVTSVKVGAGKTVAQAQETGERLDSEQPAHHPLIDPKWTS